MAEFNYLSSREFISAILVTGVSLFALLLLFFLFLKKVPELRPDDALRSFGVIIVLMGTMFVVATGFDSIQIAPAIGIFGTIAGYLLSEMGKRERERSGEAEKREVKKSD